MSTLCLPLCKRIRLYLRHLQTLTKHVLLALRPKNKHCKAAFPPTATLQIVTPGWGLLWISKTIKKNIILSFTAGKCYKDNDARIKDHWGDYTWYRSNVWRTAAESGSYTAENTRGSSERKHLMEAMNKARKRKFCGWKFSQGMRWQFLRSDSTALRGRRHP